MSKPAILSYKMSSEKVSKYEVIEIALMLDVKYSNPFRDVSIVAMIETPDGQAMQVNGFLTKSFADDMLIEWNHVDFTDASADYGDLLWKIRFSYGIPGTYQAIIYVNDLMGKSDEQILRFEVVQDNTQDNNGLWKQGPVEISDANRYYMRFKETHHDYYPVGYAIPWSWMKSRKNYADNIKILSESGGNFTRVWGAGIPQNLSLETTLLGVGKYNILHAEIQDKLFADLKNSNITVQYTFDSFTSLQSDPKWYGEWHNNPYNAENGGVAEIPLDFYVNEEAKQLFKDRLRYSIARWGADTNITCWELMNEIDGTDPYYSNLDAVVKWVEEMTLYIKQIDYYHRPISVSFAKAEGFSEINSLPCIDFVTTHYYGERDMAQATCDYIHMLKEKYKKPVLVGEYGPFVEDFEKGRDPLYLIEGLWSAIASGSFLGAQAWWWDEVIHKYEINKYLNPARKFVDSFAFSKEPLHDLTISINNGSIKGYGLINSEKSRGLLWIHNKENGWQNIYNDNNVRKDYTVCQDIEVTFQSSNGIYEIVIWDTLTGTNTKHYYQCSDNQIKIEYKELVIDSAVTFTRMKEIQ